MADAGYICRHPVIVPRLKDWDGVTPILYVATSASGSYEVSIINLRPGTYGDTGVKEFRITWSDHDLGVSSLFYYRPRSSLIPIS